MILVALDHAADAVEHGLAPRRLGGRIALPPRVDEAVRLQIALLDDPQPHLVAQPEELRVRRVVARAHGVDVRALHHADVSQHRLAVHRPTPHRIVLVAVHAVEPQRTSVREQHALHDLDPTESDHQLHGLAGFAGRPERSERAPIEPGALGTPRLDGHVHRLPGRHANAQLGDVDDRRGGAIEHRVHAQRADSGAGIQIGMHVVVIDREGRALDELDVAEDPGEPPHVLILEIGARRPAVHPHGEHVAPGPDGRIELEGQPAALRPSELLPVEPDAGARIDALEAQRGARKIPRHLELEPVVAGRILRRHTGRIERDRHRRVGVQRPLGVTDERAGGTAGERRDRLEHPVRGNADDIPVGVVEIFRDEAVARAGRGGRQPEAPRAVEALHAGIGHRVGTRRPPPMSGQGRLPVPDGHASTLVMRRARASPSGSATGSAPAA